jgi:hypothetical protein
MTRACIDVSNLNVSDLCTNLTTGSATATTDNFDQRASDGSTITGDAALSIAITLGSVDMDGEAKECAICGVQAVWYLKHSRFSAYFVNFDPKKKVWSVPPGPKEAEFHPSTGYACDKHHMNMLMMWQYSDKIHYVTRVDGTQLYCFATYQEHAEFARKNGTKPVGS